MNKIIISLMLFACLGCDREQFQESGASLGKGLEPFYEFHPNLAVAEWLHWYDCVAWISTDVFIKDCGSVKGVGADWFVYGSGGKAHAVFGKYVPEKDSYEVAFHYIVEESNKVIATTSAVDSSLALRYYRALHHGKNELIKGIDKISGQMNQYVRALESGEIEVWYLPAAQRDGVLVYGVELCFTFNKNGDKLLKKHVLNRGFRGVNIDKAQEIIIGDGTYSAPAVGEIFFALAYDRFFDKIYIESEKYLSIKVDADGGPVWIHSEMHDAEDPDSKKVTKDSNHH